MVRPTVPTSPEVSNPPAILSRQEIAARRNGAYLSPVPSVVEETYIPEKRKPGRPRGPTNKK